MIKKESLCGAGQTDPQGVPLKPHPDAAVATLRESERFAHSTVDALSAPIAILDEAGVIIAVNRAWRSFAEVNDALPLNVCEGANYLAVCDAALGAGAEQAATFAVAVHAVMRGEQQEFSLEYPCHSPDQQRWFNVRFTRFSDQGAVRVVVSVENITQRKQLEEALRESEKRFRIVADNTYDWEFWLSPDERFVYSSPSCERITSHKPEEFLADPGLLLRLIHPDDLSLYEAHYRKVCQMRLFGEEEFRVVRSDGKVRWIGQVFVPVYGEDKAFLGTRASNRDITERKRDEEMLLESEECHRSLVASSLDAVLLTVPDGRILSANQAACRLFGRSEQELIQVGRSGTLDGSDPRLAPGLEERARMGRFCGELTLLRKDGTKFPGEVSSVIFTERHGELRTSTVFRDITERKRAEAELGRSRELLRALAARMERVREEERTRIAREIHDVLGHAMTDLKLDLAWLARRLRDARITSGSAMRKRIAAMSRRVENETQVVRRIATELRPPVLDALGLVAAIEWQAREFQQRTRVHCEVEPVGVLPALGAAQITALFRLFQEVLSNVVRHAQATRTEVRLTEQAGRLVLQVHDNGRGITQAEQSGPHALGLLGMRERAGALGGELAIEGTPGRGTLVTVWIPTQPA